MGQRIVAQRTGKPDAPKKSGKQRDVYVDVLKGFAILLVVLGHSVQAYVSGGRFDDNILFRLIYSFHMPLFMFLCGAAAAYSSRPMNLDFIKRKFLMLVVPFVAWYLVGYFLTGAQHTMAFSGYIHQVVVSPDYGLWFLWVLFLEFCALAVAKWLTQWLKNYAYLVVWLAIYAVPVGKYGIGLVKWHLPFFFAGYLIFAYREVLMRYRRVALAGAVIAAPLLLLTWHRMYYPSLVTGLQPRLAAHGLSVVTLGDVVSINTYSVVDMAYRYLVPFCAIGLVCWAFSTRPARYLYGVFGFLGLYTLDIYVTHQYFLNFAVGKSWTAVISGFLIALGVSLAIGIFVLRKVPALSVIFLGGRAATATKRRRLRFKPGFVAQRTLPVGFSEKA